MWLCDLCLWLDLRGLPLFIFAIILVAYFLNKKDSPKFPPGPPALPLLGNVFSIESKQPHIYLTKLADVYGNVFCIRLGRHKTVFVSGWKMVKEAIVTQADNFVDRPYSPMVTRIYSGNSAGLFFSNGNVWRRQRRFAMTMLRTFGLAKSSLEQSICEESHHLFAVCLSLCSARQKNRNSQLGFDDGNLVLCCLDLFLAGSETTSKTLQWGLIYLIKNPHIQDKVQTEIERVIGQTRQPSMADKPNLPHTDAAIHEIQRMGNTAPLNGLRMAAKDTTLGGHPTPKGTAVMPNLTSVLFDKNEWETPDTFNPEHFLDAEGKFVRRDAFLPFSAGKRACLGEGLARMELFLFFVSLFQKFHFSTLDGVELSTEGITGATRTPYPFKIYAKAR